MYSTSLAVATTSWGVLMAMAPFLQIRAIVRRRSSVGVSISYFAVLAVGFVLWLAYGLDKDDPVLIISNSVALTVCLTVIAVAARFRHGD